MNDDDDDNVSYDHYTDEDEEDEDEERQSSIGKDDDHLCVESVASSAFNTFENIFERPAIKKMQNLPSRSETFSVPSVPSIPQAQQYTVLKFFGALLMSYFVISYLLSILLGLVGLEVSLYLLVISLVLISLATLLHSQTLAFVISKGVNLVATYVFGIKIEVNVGGIDILKRHIQKISVYLNEDPIFELQSISLLISPRSLESFHSSHRPLLTLTVEGVSVFLIHSHLGFLVQSTLRTSSMRKVNKRSNGETKTPLNFGSIGRIFEYVCIEIDKISFQYRREAMLLKLNVNNTLLSCQNERLRDPEASRKADMLPVTEFRLSIQSISLIIENGNFKLPFCSQNKIEARMTFRDQIVKHNVRTFKALDHDTPTMCNCGTASDDLKLKLSPLYALEIGFDSVDVFVSKLALEILSMMAKVCIVSVVDTNTDHTDANKSIPLTSDSPEPEATKPNSVLAHDQETCSSSDESEGWECEHCSFNNSSVDSTCTVCNKNRADIIVDSEDEPEQNDVGFAISSRKSRAAAYHKAVTKFNLAPRNTSLRIGSVVVTVVGNTSFLSSNFSERSSDRTMSGVLLLKSSVQATMMTEARILSNTSAEYSIKTKVAISNFCGAVTNVPQDTLVANHSALSRSDREVLNIVKTATSFATTQLVLDIDLTHNIGELKQFQSKQPEPHDGGGSLETPQDPWECPSCATINPALCTECELCGGKFDTLPKFRDPIILPGTKRYSHHHLTTLKTNLNITEPHFILDFSVFEGLHCLMNTYKRNVDESSPDHEQREIIEEEKLTSEIVDASMPPLEKFLVNCRVRRSQFVSHEFCGIFDVVVKSFKLVVQPKQLADNLELSRGVPLVMSLSELNANTTMIHEIPSLKSEGKKATGSRTLSETMQVQRITISSDCSLSHISVTRMNDIQKYRLFSVTGPIEIKSNVSGSVEGMGPILANLRLEVPDIVKLDVFMGVIMQAIFMMNDYASEWSALSRRRYHSAGQGYRSKAKSRRSSGLNHHRIISPESYFKVQYTASGKLRGLQVSGFANHDTTNDGHVFTLSVLNIDAQSHSGDSTLVSISDISLSHASGPMFALCQRELLAKELAFVLKLENLSLDVAATVPPESSHEENGVYDCSPDPMQRGPAKHFAVNASLDKLRIVCTPTAQLGDAITAFVRQKKGVKTILQAFRDPLSGLINKTSHIERVPSKSGSSHTKVMTNTKITASFHLRDASLRFLNDPDSWSYNDNIAKFAPKTQCQTLCKITLDKVAIQGVWDSHQHGRKGLQRKIWSLDDCGTDEAAVAAQSHGFAFVIGGRLTSASIDNLTFQLLNHRRPLVEVWSLTLDEPAEIVLGEINGTRACTRYRDILLSVPVWNSNPKASERGIHVANARSASTPIKTYHDISLNAAKLNVTYGECLGQAINALDAAIGRVIPKSSDRVSPKLPFWDKLRYMTHGSLKIQSQRFSIRILTLSPWHDNTGILVCGSDLCVTNIIPQEQMSFRAAHARSASQPLDLMDWRSLFASSSYNNTSTASQASADLPPRFWDFWGKQVSLGVVRDDANHRVEKFVLLTVPLLRIKVTMRWGSAEQYNHYVQLGHLPDSTPETIVDIYEKFRSSGCELGIMFEFGRSPNNDDSKSSRTIKQTLDVEEDEELSTSPCLTICWSSYIAICEVLRSLSPPGKSSTPKEKPTFARLLTHLKIGILADRPRILWFEDPMSESALMACATSLLAKIEYRRSMSGENASEWNPPCGYPPPWQQNALLIQCPNICGFFLPRALEYVPPIESSILFEGKAHVDVSGCGWLYWSAFPPSPSVALLQEHGIVEHDRGLLDEPWIFCPAMKLMAGQWKQFLQGNALKSGEALSEDELSEVTPLTVVLDELRMTWSTKIRDAIFMVIGSVMYQVRQQSKINERLGGIDAKREASKSADQDHVTSLETDQEVIDGILYRQRREEFDGHISGPLVDFEGIYAPFKPPSNFMSKLLLESEGSVFAVRILHTDPAKNMLNMNLLHGEFEAPSAKLRQSIRTRPDRSDSSFTQSKMDTLSIDLRWPQVWMESGSEATLAAAKSAVIQGTTSKINRVVDKISGNIIEGVEAERKVTNFHINKTQMFIPRGETAKSNKGKWLKLRPLDQPLCFTDTLFSYEFTFQHVALCRHSANDSIGADSLPGGSTPVESERYVEVLTETNIVIHESKYNLYDSNTGNISSKLPLADIPPASFQIDIPTFVVRLNTSQFFCILEIIRKLLLVTPPKDYTAIIGAEAQVSDRDEEHLRWFQNIDLIGEGASASGGDDDESSMGSPLQGSLKRTKGAQFSLKGDDLFDMQSNASHSGDLGDALKHSHAFEESPYTILRKSQSVSGGGHRRKSSSYKQNLFNRRRNRNRSMGDLNMDSMSVSENDFAANKLTADLKLLQRDVEERLASMKPASELSNYELMYSIGRGQWILMAEKNSPDVTTVGDSPDVELERIELVIDNFQGIHSFSDDGSTKVQITVGDLKALDLQLTQDVVEFNRDFRRIVQGHSTNDKVPFLRVDAATKPPMVIGDFKVNVYDMLLVLLYPGTHYLLDVHITYDVATFLMSYFKSDDETMDEIDIVGTQNVTRSEQTETLSDLGEITSTPITDANENVVSVIKSGWILKRGKMDLSWSSGKVRRNYCQLRVKYEKGKPVVVFEYFRNEIEVKLRMPPRGSIRIQDVTLIRYSDDPTSPEFAIDIVVPDGNALATYTFIPHHNTRRSRTSETSDALVLNWVAALRPFLEKGIIEMSLAKDLNDEENVEKCDEVTQKANTVFQSHLSKNTGTVKPEIITQEPLASTRNLTTEGQYHTFLQKHGSKRYILSNVRASALGLLTEDAIKLASGTLTDVVYFGYVRTSKITIGLGAVGFPVVRKLMDKRIESSAIVINKKLMTWNKFFSSLRSKIVKNLLRALLKIFSGRGQTIKRDDNNMSQIGVTKSSKPVILSRFVTQQPIPETSTGDDIDQAELTKQVYENLDISKVVSSSSTPDVPFVGDVPTIPESEPTRRTSLQNLPKLKWMRQSGSKDPL